MAGNILFYYLGDDEAYFKALQGEFHRHVRMGITFKRIYEKDEKKIQSLFLKIYKERPAAVFLDFSKETQDYLHLARLIARTPLEGKIVTVGLVDYLSPIEVLAESNATGVDFTHIKSTETYDVVFDVTKLIAPGEIGDHGFATINLSEEYQAGVPGKVGYVHYGGLHVETNFQIGKGSKFLVKHAWQKSKTVPSGEVFTRNISSANLFYHFQKAVDLDFLFIDELVLAEGMDMAEVRQKQAEREEEIRFHKKQLKKWIDERMGNSSEKKGRVLVIDGELLLYQNQTRSDRHPYIIRAIPCLEDITGEMDRTQPQVIAFVLDKNGVEEPRNHHQRLVKLVEAIKVKYKELNPLIVVFNSPMGSKDTQESLGYANIMATNYELSVELLIKMCDLYDKKRGARAEPATDRIFLKKTEPASLCEFVVNVKVQKISETDIYFTCDEPLTIGSSIHMYSPVEMYVNVQATKGGGNPPVYHGLIHCLGEPQKKELRRFVNSVFFREHDAVKATETEEYKKLNEAKLQEKLAEEKAKEEETE